jgi:hypothetical protein
MRGCLKLIFGRLVVLRNAFKMSTDKKQKRVKMLLNKARANFFHLTISNFLFRQLWRLLCIYCAYFLMLFNNVSNLENLINGKRDLKNISQVRGTLQPVFFHGKLSLKNEFRKIWRISLKWFHPCKRNILCKHIKQNSIFVEYVIIS